ncbi:MAG: hypothetical protein IH596_00360 [Bacteroidales bacterium]|nr:hypothetical protein [Bacteroidales bacterium]
MKNDFTKEKNQLKSIVEKHFTPVLESTLDDQIKFTEAVKKIQKRYAEISWSQKHRSECVDAIKQYKADLMHLVESYFAEKTPATFDVMFAAFVEALDTYIESVEDRIVRPQEPERYTSQPGDSALLKAGKVVKRISFKVSKFPERITNLFRKVFNKKQKALTQWTHHIDYKNLSRYYLKELLSMRLVNLLNGIHQKQCAASILAWKADEEIIGRIEDFLTSGKQFVIDDSVLELSDNAIRELVVEIEIVKKKILDLVGQTQAEFESAFYKAGTFELSNQRFNQSAIRKKARKLQEETLKIEIGWKGTWQVLRDDWQIDNELYHLLLSAYGATFHSGLALKSKLDDTVTPGLDKLKEYLIQAKKRIESTQGSSDQKKIITKEKEASWSKLITQLIPAVNDQILEQDFPSLIDHVETLTDSLIRQISTKRSIIRNPAFSAPIHTSSISFISPYELITFESWPQLFKVIRQVKILLIERLDTIQNSILELGQIVSFNLESALEFNAEDSASSSPGEVATEGLSRSLERIAEIEKSFADMDKLLEDDLAQGLQTFSQSLIKLTDNNNILELRVRIAKGKVIKRGILIQQQLILKATKLFPLVKHGLIRFFNQSRQFVKGTFKKYGIASKSESITADTADFLSETQQSFHKLPFVYQRLFKIEPLADSNFFIGRARELQSLQFACNNWKKGRFATVIIVGELGSGVTSMLNMFLGEHSNDTPVLRIKAEGRISTKTELFQVLCEPFQQTFNNIDEWVSYLNSQKQQVVIMEDIQRFFLKKINGFEALKELGELISRTSKTIFWIITCTEYAFRYLDKTLLLSDQFSYLIKLELFDDNTMVSIITKRHKVSGYNIRYEPAPSDLTNKKYRKLTDDEKQSLLKQEYFSDLNKIVKSNIRMALIYWLRSVSDVTGNTIVIGSLKDMNLSFLESLTATKLFILCAFILHERLTEENLGLVMNIKTVEARRYMQTLSEDGILVSNGSYFSVNPLLHMKTISLLKNKNIIH